MDILQSNSTGAIGLRRGASVIVFLGWLAFIGGIISCFIEMPENLILGIIALPTSYFVACIFRGLATLVEASEIYLYRCNIIDKDSLSLEVNGSTADNPSTIAPRKKSSLKETLIPIGIVVAIVIIIAIVAMYMVQQSMSMEIQLPQVETIH